MNADVISMYKNKAKKAFGSDKPGQIEIQGVSIVFGAGADKNVAVKETSLTINPGEFVCILGPSGCGKSTLLNSVAGYVTPSSGQVLVDGELITHPGPDRGMVFQQYSLFPWKTVVQNIGFGPKLAGCSKDECSSIANTFLAMIGLTKIADSFPGELSGGMQQRVGIARAVVGRPSILLADEPTGNLDPALSAEIMGLFEEFSRVGVTVLIASHDLALISRLHHRIITLREGRLVSGSAT